MPKIGILALQGDFAAHSKKINSLDAKAVLVKKPEDLETVAGLIIPGGESTALIKLLNFIKLNDAIIKFAKKNKPVYGTCAGIILLANKVEPNQQTLNLIDITVKRNAYGRQIDSFIAKVDCDSELSDEPIAAVFIRAPAIKSIDNKNIKTLGFYKGDPVLVKQNNILAGSFHPELTGNNVVHKYFLDLCKR